MTYSCGIITIVNALALAMALFISAQFPTMSTYALALPPFAPEHELIKKAYNSEDFSRALELARPLAEKGDPFAAYVMGRLFHPALKGGGVTRDAKTALGHLVIAAGAGCGESAYLAADIFEEGYGYQNNLAEAFKWYEKSAAMGFSGGAGAMGRLYKTGQGVSRNLAMAVECLTADSLLGNTTAQTNLAVMLIKGEGCAPDPAGALKWIVRSAEAGDGRAQQMLGQAYEAGDLGVGRDLTEACKYLTLAVSSNPAAKASLERVKRSMNRQQLRQAEREAAKWSRSAPWSDPRAVAEAARKAAEALKNAGAETAAGQTVAARPSSAGTSANTGKVAKTASDATLAGPKQTGKGGGRTGGAKVAASKTTPPPAKSADNADDPAAWPGDEKIMTTEEVEKTMLDGWF